MTAKPHYLPPHLKPGRLYFADIKVFQYPGRTPRPLAIPPKTPLFYIEHDDGWLYFLFEGEIIALDDYADSMHLKPFEEYQDSSIHFER